LWSRPVPGGIRCPQPASDGGKGRKGNDKGTGQGKGWRQEWDGNGAWAESPRDFGKGGKGSKGHWGEGKGPEGKGLEGPGGWLVAQECLLSVRGR